MEKIPYQRGIDRQNPTLFVFLLDQSKTMEELIGGNNPDNKRKMDEVALMINSWLQEMTIMATRVDGIRHYFDVATIGYCTDADANPIIESPFGGVLAGRIVCSITEIGENFAKIESVARSFFDEDLGEIVEVPEDKPVWVEPRAQGGAPMCSALYNAYEIADQWIEDHMESFPPIVIHITGGESQEGDPLPYAEALTELETNWGNLLLFNCYLSMGEATGFVFPHGHEVFPDKEARVLFEMSSVMPEPIYKMAVAEGFELQPGARGMAVNACMVSLLKFIRGGHPAPKTLR